MGSMPEGGCHGSNEWVEGLVTEHCPVMTVNESGDLFSAYVWADRGFLPFSGGWCDQPTSVTDGLDIVYREVAEENLRRQKSNEAT